MGASPPKLVTDLVERFERDRRAFRSPRCKEEQLRAEFLNPFFALPVLSMGDQTEDAHPRAREHPET